MKPDLHRFLLDGSKEIVGMENEFESFGFLEKNINSREVAENFVG